MRTLNQTSRNDIYLTSDGDLSLTDGRKAYGYILADAMRTVRGEVQLDTSKGIPYQTTVWENRKRLGLWKHYVQELIGGYDFVVSITSFEASIDGSGILNYDMTVETKDGEVTLSSALAGQESSPAPIPTVGA